MSADSPHASGAADGFDANGGESTLAAIDLGSNSFHMIVAEDESGVPRQVDKLRTRVALASGLGDSGRLAEDAQERALACLARFRERLAGVSPDRVRAVGTATFRRVRGKGGFHALAEEALGFEIEVLAGREEARMIYLGVAHSLGDDSGRRLVIDIGGASTECILGERFEAESVDSLSMGCVTFTREFFPQGKITRQNMERAELAARLQLESLEAAYRKRGWASCIGSSGTILAIDEILRRQGWGEEAITPVGLDALRDALVKAKAIDKITLDGLKPERREVIAGGVAILRGAFASLEIERMATSTGALREGLLYDLLGRIHHEDVRDRTVQQFAVRYGVDASHAESVARTALELADSAQDAWALNERSRRLLGWAALLHGVGLSVAYSGHHRHGAYLLANADLPGFSRQEQEQLATLVLYHRRKLRAEAFDAFSPARAKILRRLAILLRLAVRLHRNRGTLALPRPTLAVTGAVLRLAFPEGWLDEHPLTRADIEDEARNLAGIGFELQLT